MALGLLLHVTQPSKAYSNKHRSLEDSQVWAHTDRTTPLS
jgi:hypothetical protein